MVRVARTLRKHAAGVLRADHIGHAPAHHLAPLGMYFAVFIGLMIFTVVTVIVSRIDMGGLNTPVAIAIAIIKATLVVLWFMHVIHSPRMRDAAIDWLSVVGPPMSMMW